MIVNMFEWNEGLSKFEAENIRPANITPTSFSTNILREEGL